MTRVQSSSRVRRPLERGLLVLGCACLGWYGLVRVERTVDQVRQRRALDALQGDQKFRPRVGDMSSPGARPLQAARTSVAGRLDISRLGISVMVREGIAPDTLRLAVGHIPWTAWPGETGNIGLAGHRDTFFRPLRGVRKGDEVTLTTAAAVLRFRVDYTMVVDPEDVWVLNPSSEPVLTLVTCYPFSYIGTAPRRFIVRAKGEPATTMALNDRQRPILRTP